MNKKYVGGYIVLLVMVLLVVATSWQIDSVNKINAKLERENLTLVELNTTYESTIDALNNKNTQLQHTLQDIASENVDLQTQIEMLTLQKTNLLQQIVELKAQLKQDTAVEDPNIDFKSYMPYLTITDTTSKQWELQQRATTDSNGIRRVDGLPLVAVGTGWGLSVGDMAVVICENGNYFSVIIGDIKADNHTAADNKTSLLSGCRCEFIVDEEAIPESVKLSGNMATLEQYSGYVTHIRKAP